MPTTDTSAPLANEVAGFSESALFRATNWEAGAEAVAATSASEQNRQPYAQEEPHTSGQLALAMKRKTTAEASGPAPMLLAGG